MDNKQLAFIDASRLMVEAMVRAGADVFIGYPITPANLVYLYSTRNFPIALPAQDEITTLQWMSGFSAAGKLPVTATSFPGFALMVESINMAFMMELPMVIVLIQRMGPSTGTATQGAEGDLLLVRGLISGGFQIPTLVISGFEDAWHLSARSVELAIKYRTPVVLLTSKEMVMTTKTFDLSRLDQIQKAKWKRYEGKEPFKPYRPVHHLVPEFLPVGNPHHQVRLTSSTHDENGILRNVTPESMANTERLLYKILQNREDFELVEIKQKPNARTLMISYGITAEAVREAQWQLEKAGKPVDIAVVKTLLPFPSTLLNLIGKYDKVLIAEENLTGQLAEMMFGQNLPVNVKKICAMGRMITPDELMEEIA